MVRKPRDVPLLVISIGIPFLAAVIGSRLTAPAVVTWYPELTKPWFAPPDWVFGPVWTVLYLLMGIAIYRVLLYGWNRRDVRIAAAVFGIQIVLNVLWSAAFFGLQSPFTGLLVIFVLWSAILEAINRFDPIDRTAALLLAPYLLWVTFAAVLNLAIWLMN